MPEVVLDASAILALLRRETGAERVAGVLRNAKVSAVNLAEVGSFLTRSNHPMAEVRAALGSLRLDIVSFDEEQSMEVARLYPSTRPAGLSLGDRACLALAHLMGLPAMTTDQTWATLALGIEVEVIR